MQWDFSQALPKEFLQLPYLVYQNDPAWIPENSNHVNFLFSKANEDAAKNPTWIFCESQKVRLAAFFHPQAAYFGFFEAIDDIAIVKKAFAECEKWAKSCGAEVLYGPINFNTFYSNRIRINMTDEEGCYFGEPYNPSYYQTLLTQCGYAIAKRYVSLELPPQDAGIQFAERFREIKAPHKREELGEGLYLCRLTPELWLSNMTHLYSIVDAIFGDNFGYVPIGRPQFERLFGEAMVKKLCPLTSHCVVDDADNIMAFALSFPDYAPLLKQGNPHRIAVSDINFAEHYPMLENPIYLAKTVGVHPSLRQRGIHNAMSTAASYDALKYYAGYIGCLMREDNPSVRFFNKIATKARWCALFSKTLNNVRLA